MYSIIEYFKPKKKQNIKKRKVNSVLMQNKKKHNGKKIIPQFIEVTHQK